MVEAVGGCVFGDHGNEDNLVVVLGGERGKFLQQVRRRCAISEHVALAATCIYPAALLDVSVL